MTGSKGFICSSQHIHNHILQKPKADEVHKSFCSHQLTLYLCNYFSFIPFFHEPSNEICMTVTTLSENHCNAQPLQPHQSRYSTTANYLQRNDTFLRTTVENESYQANIFPTNLFLYTISGHVFVLFISQFQCTLTFYLSYKIIINNSRLSVIIITFYFSVVSIWCIA